MSGQDVNSDCHTRDPIVLLTEFHERALELCAWASQAVRQLKLRERTGGWEELHELFIAFGPIRDDLLSRQGALALFEEHRSEPAICFGRAAPSWHAGLFGTFISESHYADRFEKLQGWVLSEVGLTPFRIEDVDWRTEELRPGVEGEGFDATARRGAWQRITDLTEGAYPDADDIQFVAGGWGDLREVNTNIHLQCLKTEFAFTKRQFAKSQPAAPVAPVITYHGEQGYSADGITPYAVPLAEHTLLQVFLE